MLTSLVIAGLLAARAAEPVQLWVHLPDAAARQQARNLGLGFAEGQEGDWLRMDGPSGVTRDLDAAGLSWRPLALPAVPPRTDDYHDVDEMIAAVEALAASAPDLAQVVDFGDSVEGRALVGLRLSTTDSPRTSWRLVGGHHGDEWSSAEVALDAGRRLVDAYGSDAELSLLLDRDEIWLLPQLNPDGVAANSRYNAAAVDLNRNYDYQWSDREYRSGDAPFSEPEAQALRALHAWTPVAAGLSFHSGAANIGWVWNYTTTPSPDDGLVEDLADLYADDCGVPGFWRTNGADWYITYGDTTDWAYGRHGVLDFTVEVSQVKTPDDSELPGLFDDHWPGVRSFLVQPDTVALRVLDADTGLGIQAVVQPLDSGRAQVTGPDGRLTRLVLDDGAVPVRVSASGYGSVDVTLQPGDDLLDVALPRDTLVVVRPTPTRVAGDTLADVVLDVDSDSLRLERPGEDPVPAVRHGDGWRFSTTGMAPGPWDLVLDSGVAPRSLFVEEVDSPVAVTDLQVDDDGRVALVGTALGRGTRAWVLAGTARSAVPTPVTRTDDTQLQLDLGAWRGQDAPVDLVLLSRGRQLALLDVLGDAGLPGDSGDTGPVGDGGDTGPTGDGGGDTADPADSGGTPSTDAGSQDTGWSVTPRGCGCSAAASPGSASPTSPSPALLILPVLVGLATTRRRSAS